jgi:hypothetical protein
MKKYVWSETVIEGGKPFVGKLVAPPSVTGPFQSIRAAKSSRHLCFMATRRWWLTEVLRATFRLKRCTRR